VFKIDKLTAGGVIAWTSPFLEASPSTSNTKYQVHDPAIDEINPLQVNYLASYVTDFETALSSANFSDPVLGYEPYIDVMSFIDFMIVNEVSKNVDGYRISTFYHKQHISEGGLMVAGPLWDFNLAWGNADYCQGGLTSGWEINFNSVCGNGNPFHWKRLVQDPDYTHALNCRWQELRMTTLHEDTLMYYIDSMALYLSDAASRNFNKWQTLGAYIWPNNYIGNTYLEEIQYLKTWTSARLAWLDANMYGSCSDLGVHENDELRINSFPNPTTGEMNLIFNQEIKSGELTLSNVLGEIVEVENIESTSFHELNISDLTNGIYVLTIHDSGKVVGQIKIIKQ